MSQVIKSVALLFCLQIFAAAPAALADSDIAVIRDRHSPVLEQIYFGFVTTVNKRLVNFDMVDGKEAEIAKGIRLENAKAVFVVGEAKPELLAALDPKLPVVVIGHGHPEEVRSDSSGRIIVRLEKDIMPEQVLGILAELFPGKRRIGFAYNPKLTQHVIDDYKATNLAKDLSLVVLKVEQPSDIVTQITNFKDRIDLFLLLMDATVIKAGAMSLAPFLRDNRIPLISSCELFTGDGPLLMIEVNSLSVGRFASDIVTKMLGGQTTFTNIFSKRDIDLTFSLKEAYKYKLTTDQTQDLLDRAAQAGYQVRIKP